MLGTDADDLLIVEPGDVVVNGGGGIDTVELPFFVTEFALREQAPGKALGTYGDWSIELNDVEFLEFGTFFQTTVPIDYIISGEAQDRVEKLSDLYIAFFGRAPDVSGLEYWQERLLEEGRSFADISKDFAFSAEAQALYPADAGNRDFVRAIYLNAFGREPDPGGWDYWTSRLDAIESGDLNERGAFVGEVILGAYAVTSAPGDRDLLTNRHDVSLYYVNKLSVQPEEGFDQAINDLLERVTVDDATQIAAENLIDYVFADPITLTGVMANQGLVDSFFG